MTRYTPVSLANVPNGRKMVAIDNDAHVSRVAAEQGAEAVTSKHGMRMRLLTFLIMLDLAMISSGLIAVAWLYLGRVDHERLLTFLPLVLPIYYLNAVRQQAYRPSVVINAARSTRRACLSFLTSVLIVICITFIVKSSGELSRVVAIGGSVACCALLITGRYFFARFAFAALDGSLESEVVLIDGMPLPEACTAFKIDLQALNIKPDINDPEMLDRIGRMIHEADRVVVACRPERRADWSRALKGAGVNVEVLTPELDAIGAISTTRYQGVATTLIATGPLNAVDRSIKRLFDLALAVPALILLSPAMMAIAALIKLDSPGPALFVQPRIGKGNRMFRMFKFRSMRSDLLDHKASKLTTRDDVRVTRIGRFIRKTSLDELPQLLNVLRGNMSIVGPRPHARGALAGDALYWEVSSHYWNRHAVKPGLTGLAQVRGFRGNTETGDDLINRLQADLAYLDSWSIWRDLTLVMQTFRVLTHRNAF